MRRSVLTAFVGLWASVTLGCPQTETPSKAPRPPALPRVVRTPAPKPADSGRQAILRAFEAKRSEVWVEVTAPVSKVLPDDNKGDRHQRFILDLGGHTVLVAHNIDLAPRAPLERGGDVTVRGRYEYNPRGGVIHWTHHDPRGRQRGGYVQVGDKIFRAEQ